MKKSKSAARKTSRKKRAAASKKSKPKTPQVRGATPVALPVAAIEGVAAPADGAMRLLRLGRVGEDVAQWQQFLIDHGFDPGPVDGFFGGATRRATIDFQKQHHLLPDGVVGGRTRRAAEQLGFAAPTAGLAFRGIAHDEDDIVGHFSPGVTVFETRDGCAVYCTTGMKVDADGAYRAYKIRNLGLDFDDNGKDPSRPGGRWVGVVTNAAGEPIPQQAHQPAPGYLISTTALQDQMRAVTDPLRYVDAESVPYIVLPGGHLGRASLGDYALVVNTETRKTVPAIAADSGAKNKIGEASMAGARALLGEAASNPRSGGTERPIIRYIVFPDSKDHVFPASDPRQPVILERTLRHINMMAAMRFAALDPTHQMALLS